MKRLLPQPVISAALFLTWLLLYNSVAPVVVIGGIALALLLPLWTHRFWPEYPRRIRVVPLVRLIGVIIFDIVIANLRMVVLILGPRSRLRPQFVTVPVTARDPYTITLFASVISLTPGTVSANLSGDRRTLLVHELDVADAEASVRRMKDRYEKPLMEIFE